MNMDLNLESVSAFILNNVHYVLLIMTVLIFIALIVFININIKLTKMNKRYRKLMMGMDGCNIERLLMGHIDEVRDTVQKVEALEAEYKRVDAMNRKAVQKVGVVRFSPFEEIGSDLSFAVAFLDHHNDGVVFSSIFGRDESRCYAKPIKNGESTYVLTEEEKQALSEAMKK